MRTIFIVLLFLCLKLNAQTVIDYANLSGSTCIFTSATDVPATINGASGTVKHLATVGEIRNGSLTKTLNFDSHSTNNVGSEYRIEYNFKKGYSYSIVVNARSINNSGDFPKLRLKLTNNTNVSTTCQGPQSIDLSLTGTLLAYQNINNGSFLDYPYTFNAIGSDNPYLTIANIPSSNGGFQTIEIAKITITETGSPDLVLSPSSLSIVCGTNTERTFTVSNPNNVANITSYEWDLGSSNNGWLYNGSAAPQNISTTTNSIALTPACGSSPSDVFVTVRVDSQDYKTYSSDITTTTPTLSMSVPSSVCSSSSFSINNLPCDATVSWTSSNTSVATVPSTGHPATVSRVGTANGNVTITAVVTSACFPTPQTLAKTVRVGSPYFSYSVSGASPVYANAGYYYSLQTPLSVNVNSIVWRVPSGWSITNGQGTKMITAWTGTTGGAVEVDFKDDCGASWGTYKTVTIGGGGPDPLRTTRNGKNNITESPAATSIQVYPNPVKDQLFLTLPNEIAEGYAEIIDLKGALVQKVKLQGTLTTINTAALKSGYYLIKIKQGEEQVQTVKFVKE